MMEYKMLRLFHKLSRTTREQIVRTSDIRSLKTVTNLAICLTVDGNTIRRQTIASSLFRSCGRVCEVCEFTNKFCGHCYRFPPRIGTIDSGCDTTDKRRAYTVLSAIRHIVVASIKVATREFGAELSRNKPQNPDGVQNRAVFRTTFGRRQGCRVFPELNLTIRSQSKVKLPKNTVLLMTDVSESRLLSISSQEVG